MTRRGMLLGAAALIAGWLHAAARPAAADSYPAQPVRLIVPFTAGGATDIIARLLAAEMSRGWGKQGGIDNRAGAAGLIAAEATAKSAPDGYTLLMATASTHGTNKHLFRQLPYDPVADFAPVMLVTRAPFILVVNPQLAAGSAAELIALAQK